MRLRFALAGAAALAACIASIGARASQAAVHTIAGHGSIARVASGPEGLDVTYTHLSIAASDTPGWLGWAAHRPRIMWGPPLLIILNCVEVESISWSVPGGGLVRGHDVFASGSSASGPRFIRLRVFDRRTSSAPVTLLRDSFAVSPYREATPCGAPSRVGEPFGWSRFHVTHAWAA